MICEATNEIPSGTKPPDLAYRLLAEAKVEVEDDGIKEFSNGSFAVALSPPARVPAEAEYKPEPMPDEATRFELLQMFYGAYKDELGAVNLPNVARREIPSTSVSQDEHTELGASRADEQFALAADYSTIFFNGGPHTPTKTQRSVLKTLYEQLKLGITQVPQDTLKNAMGNGAGSVKDAFKRSPLWGKLIVSNSRPKGTYSLNLSACSHESSTDDSATAPQARKDPTKTPQRPA